MLALALALAAVGACTDPAAEHADAPTVRFMRDADNPGDAASPGNASGAIEVSGLSPGTLATLARLRAGALPAVLAVYTQEAAIDPQAPPMLGEHRVEEGRLVFTPRFPFAPGMSYVARYMPPDGGASTKLEFHLDALVTSGDTRVTEIYPSADVWPMNQLKMYVHFSAPMRAGRAFEHVRLVNEATGAEVEQPFVTVQEELWDRDRRILTVLYDPARIKRGLVPNQQAGLPLQAGGAYRLVIDADWRDAEGRPLAAPFARAFRVGDQDRTSPRPDDWSIDVPDAGTTDPLTIGFGEPMDHGLLHSLIGVRRASLQGRTGGWHTRSVTSAADELAGRVEISGAESVWRFYPAAPWPAGDYEIVVPTILEDLAGNNLKNLFDADRGSAPSAFAEAEAAYFGFHIGNG